MPNSVVLSTAVFSGTAQGSLARTSGPVTRTAVGAAADQTDSEIARISVPGGRLTDAYQVLRLQVAMAKIAAIATNVGILLNLGIGPTGVSYGASAKFFPSDDSTSLVAVGTVGQTRASWKDVLIIGQGPTSQRIMNAYVPVASVGPSANVLTATAVDFAAGFDIVLGARFAASAPVGDNFTMLTMSLTTA